MKRSKNINIINALNNRSLGKSYKFRGKFSPYRFSSRKSKTRYQINGLKRAIPKLRAMAQRARVRVAARQRRIRWTIPIAPWRRGRGRGYRIYRR